MMKFSPTVLLCAGLLACVSAQAASQEWQKTSWTGDVVLEKGVYEGLPAGIGAQDGCNIKVNKGCRVGKARIVGRGNVTWEVNGSLFYNAAIFCGPGGKFHMADSLFQNFEMGFLGQANAELWSSRWSFENCVFAGKFAEGARVTTACTSISATRCTFHDVDLPKVIYRHPMNEAQAAEFQFVNCRFVRCKVQESFLAATVDCLFEDCEFSGDRGNWARGTKVLTVTASVTGTAAPPQSYLNGNLKVNFQPAQPAAGGATLAYTYTKGVLAFREPGSFGRPKILGAGAK